MRTNIDIEDALMDAALRAGPYKTKKDAVEAGLQLVARQAAYREILKWEGKLHWEDSPGVPGPVAAHAVNALPPPVYPAPRARPRARRKP